MAKKEKRISINALEKVAEVQYPETTVCQWYDVEITIKRTLPLMEMLEFVKEVSEACFMEDGTYMPEMLWFAVKSGVLTHYANFTLPTNLEKHYWLIYQTDAYETVLPHINEVQFGEILKAIDDKVDYLCEADIFALRLKVSDLTQTLENVIEKVGNMTKDVSVEDMMAVLGGLSETGGFDPDKVVNAYIDRTKADNAEDDAE